MFCKECWRRVRVLKDIMNLHHQHHYHPKAFGAMHGTHGMHGTRGTRGRRWPCYHPAPRRRRHDAMPPFAWLLNLVKSGKSRLYTRTMQKVPIISWIQLGEFSFGVGVFILVWERLLSNIKSDSSICNDQILVCGTFIVCEDDWYFDIKYKVKWMIRSREDPQL